jgi:hypothetical protein
MIIIGNAGCQEKSSAERRGVGRQEVRAREDMDLPGKKHIMRAARPKN